MNDSDDVNELLKEVDEVKARTKRKGRVELWLEKNPQLADLFWRTLEAAHASGRDIALTVRVFRAKYDGPPGAENHLRALLNDRIERR